MQHSFCFHRSLRHSLGQSSAPPEQVTVIAPTMTIILRTFWHFDWKYQASSNILCIDLFPLWHAVSMNAQGYNHTHKEHLEFATEYAEKFVESFDRRPATGWLVVAESFLDLMEIQHWKWICRYCSPVILLACTGARGRWPHHKRASTARTLNMAPLISQPWDACPHNALL